MCITETWLKDGILSSELFPASYNVYRRDRDPIVSGKCDGGGVLIGVCNSLKSSSVPQWHTTGIIEDLWVSITLDGGKKLFICCIYAPPHAVLNNFILYFNKLEDILNRNKENEFIIIGDFNLRNLTWEFDLDTNSYLPSIGIDPISEYFVDIMSFLNLKQYCNITNARGNVLDLLLSVSLNMNVSQCADSFVTEDSNHKAFEVSIDLSTQKLLPSSSYNKVKFFDADYVVINEYINNIDWKSVLHNKNVNYDVEAFYEIINNVIEFYIPKKTVRKGSHPIWFSAATKVLIRNKDKFHKKWKKFNNVNDYHQFSVLRKRLKDNIRNDYKKYINKTEESLQSDTKCFWSYVNNKKSTKTIPQTMIYDEIVASENQSICDLFMNYFGSVYEPNTRPSDIPLVENNLNPNFNITNITRKQILDALKNLDIKKGPGPDGIPAIFLKSCCESLVEPLYIIYNKCLQSGHFPEKWKIAQVIPIYKSGDKVNVKNYRPISLLDHFGKVFELLIANELFFLAKNYINVNQHGFYSKRSVVTNLAPYVQNILETMEDGASVCAVYTDFSKAFDKVDHPTLIIKLRNFGVHGQLLMLLSSYIKNRSQYVAINNFKSDCIDVTSGVPQGSHLGPLLFNIFINDIDKCFTVTKHVVYADDLKIYHRINSTADYDTLQSDLNKFSEFCKLHKFFINLDKCFCILFSRCLHPPLSNLYLNNTQIKSVNVAKDLGLLLDSKLSFECHIDHIVKKALRTLGFIFRVTSGFNKTSSIITLFNTVVLPIIEYASTIWNPMYNKYIFRLERVQKKFVNTLNHRFNRHRHYFSYENNLTFYKLDLLSTRRVFFDICFVYKIFNNMCDSPYCVNYYSLNCNPYLCRNRNILVTIRYNTNFLSNSPLIRCSSAYNNISCFNNYELDIYHLSFMTFKSHLKKYLRNAPR